MQSLLSSASLRVSQQFRHLASELRDSRQHSQASLIFSRLCVQLEGLLSESSQKQLLPKGLLQVVNVETKALAASTKCRVFVAPGYFLGRIFGYTKASWQNIEIDPEFYQPMLFISPGLISSVWPEVFKPLDAWIDFNTTCQSEDELLRTKQFEVIGFYSEACNRLACWIESNPVDAEIMEPLTEGEKRRVLYLASHAKGVTYEEFQLATFDGHRLTKSDNTSSIRTMMSNLSRKLSPYFEISCPEVEDRIQLIRLSECN